MSQAVTLTAEEQLNSLITSTPRVAIYVYENWCTHDVALYHKTVEQLAVPGRLAFAIMRYGDLGELITEMIDLDPFGQPDLPAWIVYQDGEVADTGHGVDEKALKSWVKGLHAEASGVNQ
ncbi:hypothetical protein PT974_04858 [Cladobotryum mycophilum]|uniref:Thioredoxin domain-containing protein n=1 Tax=Cladobotryum mycophilum TaxID=491253 RepID=A0ABR0SQP9_9HYPO